jgi:hypothetical protein
MSLDDMEYISRASGDYIQAHHTNEFGKLVILRALWAGEDERYPGT